MLKRFDSAESNVTPLQFLSIQLMVFLNVGFVLKQLEFTVLFIISFCA